MEDKSQDELNVKEETVSGVLRTNSLWIAILAFQMVFFDKITMFCIELGNYVASLVRW